VGAGTSKIDVTDYIKSGHDIYKLLRIERKW
jgi:hypothetical protein